MPGRGAFSIVSVKIPEGLYFMSFTVASLALTKPDEQALLNSSLSIAPSLFEIDHGEVEHDGDGGAVGDGIAMR